MGEESDAKAEFDFGYANWWSPEDDVEAASRFRRSAEQGDPESQFQLGLAYAKGWGVSQDDAEAVRWFRRSAERGHSAAQCNLGLAYAAGRSVPQDGVEAVRWFRRSAEQNDPEAQFALGLAYAEGRGVKQDAAEALPGSIGRLRRRRSGSADHRSLLAPMCSMLSVSRTPRAVPSPAASCELSFGFGALLD